MAQSSSSAPGCQSSHLSVSSCRKQERADSAESHDGCVGTNVSGLHEATHHDHGYKVNRDIEANHPLNHVCSVLHNSRHACEVSIHDVGRRLPLFYLTKRVFSRLGETKILLESPFSNLRELEIPN